MKKAAVLPAYGIGDSLLMMIASHRLRKAGFSVTTFHHALPELAPWFPKHDLQPLPLTDKLFLTLRSFDLILVENDNTQKIKQLVDTYRHSLCILYPTYSSTKHSPLSSHDRVFNPNLPMAD